MFLDGFGAIQPMALFTYAWELPFVEAVVVYDEDDAISYRSRDAIHLDLFAPRNVVWRHPGTFVGAVAELLALPHPGSSEAPSRVITVPSSLWVPRQQNQNTIETLRTRFKI